MKKNSKLHIPISSEHKALLEKRAVENGLKLAQYCLVILLNSKIKKIQIEG